MHAKTMMDRMLAWFSVVVQVGFFPLLFFGRFPELMSSLEKNVKGSLSVQSRSERQPGLSRRACGGAGPGK